MRKLTNAFPILAIAIMLFMFGCEQVNSPNHESERTVATTAGSISEAHVGSGIVYVNANASGIEDGSSSNPYGTIQEGVDHANNDDVVLLQSDFTLSSQVTISKPLTLDGNGNTILTSFARNGDYSNNAAIGIIGTSGVTVSDITIDGANGDKLHGINVYVSTGVLVNNVSIKDNDHTGLVVNGSEVTAHNISTSGHSWHGINVDQGGNVNEPGILTVTGVSSHDETLHIYIDNVERAIEVHDEEGQYNYEEFDNLNDIQNEVENPRTAGLYTLKPNPVTKDDCKDGGYADYGFENQGQCIQFVNTGKDSR